MTRATLSAVLQPALTEGYAVAGLVVLGWEEARAYVDAAEAENVAIILQAGPGFRAHMPLEVVGPMFRYLAETASAPVVTHLDHSTDIDECQKALDLGFTSVMFDGSRLSLADNIAHTKRVAEMAHAAGASCEGEIGFVGYAEGAPGAVTNADEAQRFAAETGVDAMAISIGNVHLQTAKHATIDRTALAAIEAVTDVPLVLHGGSGISDRDRQWLSQGTAVCKFNIGTELRQAYGRALRQTLAADEAVFDRIKIAKATYPAVVEATRAVLRGLT